MPRYHEQFSWNTAQDKDQITTTLSDAAIIWGDPVLVAKLNRLKKRGYTGQTIGAILGTETPSERLADPYCNILDRLRRTLIEKLQLDELVAIAFTATRSPGADRDRVHPGRWRILTPDFSNYTAQGGGLELFDVLVTTPRNRVFSGLASSAGLPLGAASEVSADPTAPLKLAVAVDPVIPPSPPHLPHSPIRAAAAAPPDPAPSDDPATRTWALCTAEKTFRQGHEKLSLTNRQFELLHLLTKRLKQGDRIVSSREIYAHIFYAGISNYAVRELVGALRKALDVFRSRSGSKLIQNRHGQGYMLGLEAGEIDIR